jgi:hypothetical protein
MAETTTRRIQLSDYTRLYWQHGHVAHLMPGYSASVSSTMCGEGPDSWMLGTGSQDEYDKAARLPTCKRCKAAALVSA